MKKKKVRRETAHGAEAVESLIPAMSQPLDKLLTTLQIEDVAIEFGARQQPNLFEQAARLYGRSVAEEAAAKARYEEAAAASASAFRDDADERVTEAQVKEHVAIDPDVQTLRAVYGQAKALEAYAKLLVDAFRMRRDALRIAADLNGGAGSGQIEEAESRELNNAVRQLNERVSAEYSADDDE